MREIIDYLRAWFNADTTWALAAKLTILCLPFLGLVVYFVMFAGSTALPSPCLPNGFPGRCYRVSQHLCEITWTRAEAPCREFVQSLKLPLGRVTGPTLFRCQFMHVDRAFTHSRKNGVAECAKEFAKLEEWKRSNGF